MLEIGACSLLEPHENTHIRSMVESLFPTIQTTIVDSEVATALASKTFLEKVFLLHELFSVEGHGEIADRKSRHLYDLSRMMDKDFALSAIDDDALWESIRHIVKFSPASVVWIIHPIFGSDWFLYRVKTLSPHGKVIIKVCVLL